MPWISFITENSHLSSKTVLSKNPKQAQRLVQRVSWGSLHWVAGYWWPGKGGQCDSDLKGLLGVLLGQGCTLLDGTCQWWSVSHSFLLTTLNFYVDGIFPYQFFPSLPMALNSTMSLLSCRLLLFSVPCSSPAQLCLGGWVKEECNPHPSVIHGLCAAPCPHLPLPCDLHLQRGWCAPCTFFPCLYAADSPAPHSILHGPVYYNVQLRPGNLASDFMVSELGLCHLWAMWHWPHYVSF